MSDIAGLIEWLNEELALAEKSLRARLQLEEGARRDPAELWKELAALPGSIITTTRYRGRKPPSESERLKEADSHRRIAKKDRRRVEMFKATIAALQPADPEPKEGPCP